MEKTLLLIDGENLVLRYEALLQSGKQPKDTVVHQKDTFVWCNGLCHTYAWDVKRISYYSTFVGSDQDLEDLCKYISTVPYTYSGISARGSGTLNPRIFKKAKRSAKTKSVDINITIDALRHAHLQDVQRIILCSGDGDYIPLIQELMRQGIIAHIAAFSDGCHPQMKYIADDFTDLDEIYFTENDDHID